MKPFERNIAAIASRFPDLANFLGGIEPSGVEAERAASGEMTARAGGIYLHSAYDPRLEADRLARSLGNSGADTVVIFGGGLGYMAEAVLAHMPETRVLLAEADAAAFAACLRIRDISQLLAREELGLIINADPDSLFYAFDRLESRSLAVHENKALVLRSLAWYERARAAVERFEGKERINENTLRRFGKRWVRNLASNARQIGLRDGIADLSGAFSGLPALVCAAGPSLDDILPYLAELKKRMLVVAVDTALRSLLRAGVEPDFLIVVDPQYWNVRHLDRCAAPHAVMIAEGATWPSVFRFPCSSIRLCSSLFPLGAFLEERANAVKGKLGAGGSVATSAWDFARILGSSPIYMAGLDLSFPDGKTHSSASFFEQRALSRGSRLKPAATEGFEAMLGAGPFKAPSNDGAETTTDKRMILYAWWFESRMYRHPESPTKTFSSKALAIPGMGIARIEDALSLPCARAAIDERLAREVIPHSGDSRKNLEAAHGTLMELLSEIEDLSRSALDILKKTRQAARAGENVKPWLLKLDKLDRRLMSNAAKDVAGFLFPPLATIIGARARSFEETLDRSETIYAEIAETAAYHREILSEGE